MFSQKLMYIYIILAYFRLQQPFTLISTGLAVATRGLLALSDCELVAGGGGPVLA